MPPAIAFLQLAFFVRLDIRELVEIFRPTPDECFLTCDSNSRSTGLLFRNPAQIRQALERVLE
jgi:hypothetical protein